MAIDKVIKVEIRGFQHAENGYSFWRKQAVIKRHHAKECLVVTMSLEFGQIIKHQLQ